MLSNIEWLGHSSIKICKNGKVIYIDPFRLNKSLNDANIIFVTHNHYDHYSYEDIVKIMNDNTKFVVTSDLYDIVCEYVSSANVISVLPNNTYDVDGIKFSTVCSYNINKQFHPKENNWVGYIIELDDYKYYIAGDTDINEDNKLVKCDVAFVPVGGTYTMTATEAAELVNIIKPSIAVPIHYGSIVGDEKDVLTFIDEVDMGIEVVNIK
ncbi:MAG: MBL fold metallo-hydrolase [Candidatus Coprovivens sp.]